MMLPPSSIKRGCGPGNSDQGIDADVVGDAKTFAAGVEEIAFQFGGRRIGNTVHHDVQFSVTFFQLAKVRSISSSLETSHMKPSAPAGTR